jgi:RNA polymerase sigma-70 factor, ECF subfamily
MSSVRALDYAGRPDAELATLAAGGDGEAFRAIMQRFNPRLFRIARGVLRDDADAEDALQEAYVSAYKALPGFRGESALLTWLTAITLNEARMRLRRRRPHVGIEALETEPAPLGRILAFPLSQPAADPEGEAARSQARRLLERAVDSLPEGFRIVFVLRELEGCSVEETAEQLDLKPETVKTRLHRARRLLRQRLDESLSLALKEAFPFLGARCARLCEAVLARLASAPQVQL